MFSFSTFSSLVFLFSVQPCPFHVYCINISPPRLGDWSYISVSNRFHVAIIHRPLSFSLHVLTMIPVSLLLFSPYQLLRYFFYRSWSISCHLLILGRVDRFHHHRPHLPVFRCLVVLGIISMFSHLSLMFSRIHLPLGLFPCISLSNTILVISSVSLLRVCPYQLSLPLVVTFAPFRISSLLACSFKLIPCLDPTKHPGSSLFPLSISTLSFYSKPLK